MSLLALAGGTIATALGGSGVAMGLASDPKKPGLVVFSALLLGGGAVLTAMADRFRRNEDEDEGDDAGDPEWESPGVDSAADAYERFHWGRRPKRLVRGTATADDILFELGKLRRVEYETRKGDEQAIYFHDFSEPYPLLTGTTDGFLGPIVGGRARVKPQGIVR